MTINTTVATQVLFDAVAIRTTGNFYSAPFNVQGMLYKRLHVNNNGADQIANLTIEVSFDGGTTWVWAGNGTVAASTPAFFNETQLGLGVIDGLCRLRVSYSTAPTVGAVTAVLQMMSNS